MSSVSTASITSDSAELEPTSGAGVGAVSVACSKAFITAWSVQPSGESDGAGPFASLGAVSPAARWGWMSPACCKPVAEVGPTDAARTQARGSGGQKTRRRPSKEGGCVSDAWYALLARGAEAGSG
eukprot:scaffold44814_cov58-Phaeocystis_antarctica.AAC.2